jgi:hypothetical protein
MLWDGLCQGQLIEQAFRDKILGSISKNSGRLGDIAKNAKRSKTDFKYAIQTIMNCFKLSSPLCVLCEGLRSSPCVLCNTPLKKGFNDFMKQKEFDCSKMVIY